MEAVAADFIQNGNKSDKRSHMEAGSGLGDKGWGDGRIKESVDTPAHLCRQSREGDKP